MQTVRAYETSGGAYVVARENLGTMPSLVAAAALLVDYILTVAVSVAAGVLAMTSAAPSLAGHEVGLSLGFIVLLTIVNLRGVRESGVLFAVPTYAFVAVMFLLVGTGVGQCATGGCHQAHAPDPIAAGAGAVGLIVLLQAFASGASALTGVEAISNGVSAFRPPSGRNAARTLLAMALIAIALFVGVSYLAVPHERPPQPERVCDLRDRPRSLSRRPPRCRRSTTPCRPSRSRSSCSLRTPRTRVSHAWQPFSHGIASSRASS